MSECKDRVFICMRMCINYVCVHAYVCASVRYVYTHIYVPCNTYFDFPPPSNLIPSDNTCIAPR